MQASVLKFEFGVGIKGRELVVRDVEVKEITVKDTIK